METYSLMLPAAQIPGFAALSRTVPEPSGDIKAQIASMLSPKSAKDTVFLSHGNEKDLPKDLPESVHVIAKSEGVLLTTNEQKAQIAQSHPWSDAMMANLLGYPENKASAIASGNPVALQARDKAGNVVSESAVSSANLPTAVPALASHLAGEGGVTQIPLAALLLRRLQA